jgi:chromosomal replication initiation ATPase DnaA
MVTTDFVLEHFGRNRALAVRAFHRFVMESSREGSREDFYDVKLQTVLGSDDFVEKLPVRSHEEKVHYQVPLEEIVQSVCRRFKLGEEELRRPDRGRRAAEARHKIGYIARELAGLTYGSVAQRFGREAISFSVCVRRVAKRMEREAEFKQEMDGICREIGKGKRRKY